MRNYYTEKEQKQLLNSMVILVDSRENANSHILDYLKAKKLNFIERKLDYGDYSFKLPKNPDLGITQDIWFDDEIVIERKGSLTELSGNIGNKRTQFENELIRKKNSKFYLMVEYASWEMIKDAKYSTDYSPNAFQASMYTFMARYNVMPIFLTKNYAPFFIHGTFKYYLREVLSRFTEVQS